MYTTHGVLRRELQLCCIEMDRVHVHGEKRVIGEEKEEVKVDGYEPTTNTVQEYHGCPNTYSYEKMKKKAKTMQELDYNLVTIWECENPSKAKRHAKKEFTSYPHYIVFDFNALLATMNQQQTANVTNILEHVPVSVVILDCWNDKPKFIEHEDPKVLVKRFIEELEKRRKSTFNFNFC